jgi:hypothetical protein
MIYRWENERAPERRESLFPPERSRLPRQSQVKADLPAHTISVIHPSAARGSFVLRGTIEK